MSRWRTLLRAFKVTIVKVSSEVRHIELRYWIAMIGVAAVGDAVVIVVSR